VPALLVIGTMIVATVATLVIPWILAVYEMPLFVITIPNCLIAKTL
jgi:hypothetical protein